MPVVHLIPVLRRLTAEPSAPLSGEKTADAAKPV
jgi:hypothetical protein